MQDAVDAAEIDESAIAGDILDVPSRITPSSRTLRISCLRTSRSFSKKLAPGEYDVAARAVEFQNREAVLGADESVEIAVGPNIDMGAR